MSLFTLVPYYWVSTFQKISLSGYSLKITHLKWHKHTFFFGLGLWSAGLGQRRCLSFCLFCVVFIKTPMLVQLLKKKVAALSNWQLPKSCPAVSLWNSRNLYTNTCRKKGIVIVLTRRIGPRSHEVCCHSILCMFKIDWQITTEIRTFSANFKRFPRPLKAISKEAKAIFGTSRTNAFHRYPYCWGAIKTKRNGKYGYCFLNKDKKAWAGYELLPVPAPLQRCSRPRPCQRPWTPLWCHHLIRSSVATYTQLLLFAFL